MSAPYIGHMELEKLKAFQESLSREIELKPYDFAGGYVLALDSSYILKTGEIVSAAVLYDTEKKALVEKAFSKKKFCSPIFLDFSHSGRLIQPLRQLVN